MAIGRQFGLELAAHAQLFHQFTDGGQGPQLEPQHAGVSQLHSDVCRGVEHQTQALTEEAQFGRRLNAATETGNIQHTALAERLGRHGVEQQVLHPPGVQQDVGTPLRRDGQSRVRGVDAGAGCGTHIPNGLELQHIPAPTAVDLAPCMPEHELIVAVPAVQFAAHRQAAGESVTALRADQCHHTLQAGGREISGVDHARTHSRDELRRFDGVQRIEQRCAVDPGADGGGCRARELGGELGNRLPCQTPGQFNLHLRAAQNLDLDV